MATLKISDLSVGDWVLNHRGFPTKVQVITSEGNILCGEIDAKSEHCTHLWVQDIHPIPITPEILEANGLYRHEADADNPKSVVMSNSCMLAKTYEDVDWWRVLIYDEEELSAELFNGIVYSVHQLQHALRLASVDKEIVMTKK